MTQLAAKAARRAALFGSASGRHRVVQPIPRQPTLGGVAGTAAAVQAADRAVLRTGGLAQIEEQVLHILAASKQTAVADLLAGDLGPDGSLAIDSMSAVFVCRIVARVLGPRDWAGLRGHSQPEDFVSVRAVSALIARRRRAVAVA